jgi:diguanylate cyclase (GGDEF)-like protein
VGAHHGRVQQHGRSSGAAIAERLRLALEQSRIDSGEGRIITITLSAGRAPLAGDAEHTLAQADAALYQAKNSGRNRIVLA